jgi:hypothetical protein
MKTLLLLASGLTSFTLHTSVVQSSDSDRLAESQAWKQAFIRCGDALPLISNGSHSRDEKVDSRFDATFECAGGLPDLGARIAESKWVIQGTVTEIGNAKIVPTGSEHDPRWKLALVQVQETWAGAPAKTMTVAFASSDDVAWHAAPKLLVGQQAIFVLHPMPGAEGSMAVLSSLDVQPLSSRDVVYALTHATGAPTLQR